MGKSMQEICLEKYNVTHRWQWKQRKFWLGGILAAYAHITGSVDANNAADKLFEKYKGSVGVQEVKDE